MQTSETTHPVTVDVAKGIVAVEVHKEVSARIGLSAPPPNVTAAAQPVALEGLLLSPGLYRDSNSGADPANPAGTITTSTADGDLFSQEDFLSFAWPDPELMNTIDTCFQNNLDPGSPILWLEYPNSDGFPV